MPFNISSLLYQTYFFCNRTLPVLDTSDNVLRNTSEKIYTKAKDFLSPKNNFDLQ